VSHYLRTNSQEQRHNTQVTPAPINATYVLHNLHPFYTIVAPLRSLNRDCD
jgi:hypothetical protein